MKRIVLYAFVALVMVALAFLGGMVGMSWGMSEMNRADNTAVVSGFLVTVISLFGSVSAIGFTMVGFFLKAKDVFYQIHGRNENEV